MSTPVFTKTLESATRKKIDLILVNLGWNTDETSPDCNVFTESERETRIPLVFLLCHSGSSKGLSGI